MCNVLLDIMPKYVVINIDSECCQCTNPNVLIQSCCWMIFLQRSQIPECFAIALGANSLANQSGYTDSMHCIIRLCSTVDPYT